LTIREAELEKCRGWEKDKEAKDSLVNELEKRLKHTEKKYEKQI